MTLQNTFLLLCSLILGLTTLAKAQTTEPIEGIFYTTQRHDTLAHLTEKYLDDVAFSQSIIQATETQLGYTPPAVLPPGLTLFIPLTPLPTPTPPPTVTSSPTLVPSLTPTTLISPTVSPAATVTPLPSPTPISLTTPPQGKIAFGFYNRALARRVWEIDIIHVDGSNRQVFRWNEVSEPAISPDGTHIAFRGWRDTGHVLSVGPLDGTRYWPIGGYLEDSHPDWSHDGSRLVFASQRESDRLWRMYTIHANAENEHILARTDGLPLFGEDPAWSHGDDRIIYKGCAPTGEDCGLWFITLDGQVSAPILVDSTAIQPDGSPTSDEVVFASMQSGNWEIYVVNLDGSDLRPLTNHPAIDGLPTWSPDGEWLAFQSSRPGATPTNPFESGPTQGGQSTTDNWGIWVIRHDGRDLHQIFAFDGGLMKANRLDLPYGSRDWFDEQISWGR